MLKRGLASPGFQAGVVRKQQTASRSLPDTVNMLEEIDGTKLQTGRGPDVLVALRGELFFESIRQTIRLHATRQSHKRASAAAKWPFAVPSTTNYGVSLASTLK